MKCACVFVLGFAIGWYLGWLSCVWGVKNLLNRGVLRKGDSN